jgi:hypothetical protein
VHWGCYYATALDMVEFDFRIFVPWMAGHPCLTRRARSLSLQGSERDDPGPPAVPADRQRFGPSCVLLNACHKAERREGV